MKESMLLRSGKPSKVGATSDTTFKARFVLRSKKG
jgi:hypothetical protein